MRPLFTTRDCSGCFRCRRQRPHTRPSVQARRQLSLQHAAAKLPQDRHRMDPPPAQGYMRDIRHPDKVLTAKVQFPQQIRTHLRPGPSQTQPRLGIHRLQTHFLQPPLRPLHVEVLPVPRATSAAPRKSTVTNRRHPRKGINDLFFRLTKPSGAVRVGPRHRWCAAVPPGVGPGGNAAKLRFSGWTQDQAGKRAEPESRLERQR